MRIFLLEPFLSGSHQRWAEGLQSHSRHDIKILALPGRHWKWRMYGGAVALAAQFNQLKERPDLILATDMLDLTTFLALTKKSSADIPTAIYFHENQITYPWSPDDADVALGRNNQYGFINYTSALVADHIFFNSNFHRNSFLEALPAFLGQFPDHKGLDNIEVIKNKSSVLPLGMDLHRFDKYKSVKNNQTPTLLWNHRWEYDKNPDLFFDSLFKLKNNGHIFNLIVLGESYKKSPPIFKKAKKELAENIFHFGYADTFEKYASLLCQSDITPVTSRQDFFGGSVVEAIYCNCFPILPKRLAFPEHLPKEIHDDHFYGHENDFYTALEASVSKWSPTKNFIGEKFVKKYEWNNLINKYDHTFRLIPNK
jgi:glycosyltransferase involved in cell wall biosynthesis